MIQFDIIHEKNKDNLGILECVHEFYVGEERRGEANEINALSFMVLTLGGPVQSHICP